MIQPSIPPSLKPIYSVQSPDLNLNLYHGPMTLVKGEERICAEGKVFWRWSPNPEIRIDLDKPNTSEKFDLNGFRLQLPNYSDTIDVTWFRKTTTDSTRNLGCLASLIPINLFSSDLSSPTTSHVGRLSTVKLSSGSKVRSILFHIVNFRDFTGIRIRYNSGVFEGRAVLSAGDWIITIDCVENFEHLEQELLVVGGHIISHVGEIRRSDGSDFDPKINFQDLWDGLHYFLSFSRGLWSAPILPVGLNQNGQKVWELWEVPIIDSWKNFRGWFNMNHQTLTDLFPGFWALWINTTYHDSISQAIFWYIESSKIVASTGGSVLLQQAAVENLSWLKLVLIDTLHTDKKAFKKRDTDLNMTDLLSACGCIPNAIPTELSGLTSLGQDTSVFSPVTTSGPKVITYLRNSLAHGQPERIQRIQRLTGSGDTLLEAWKLGKHYLELVLLYLFNYQGHYRNWIPRSYYSKRDPGVLVPWVPSASPASSSQP